MTSTPRASDRRVDIVRWALAILIGLGCAASLALLQGRGTGSRVFDDRIRLASEPPAQLTVVDTSAGFREALLNSGRRGRVLVYLSRFLHFVPVSGAIPDESIDFPIAPIDLLAEVGRRVDHGSLLWVSLHDGVAREVVHVLPPGDYRRHRQVVSSGAPGVSLGSDSVVTHELGSRRTLRSTLPRMDEAVILGIDAAYFDTAEVSDVLDLLGESELMADLVVVNLSHDNPDVTDVGRERASRLAVELSGGQD
jgi:hypothetical protein